MSVARMYGLLQIVLAVALLASCAQPPQAPTKPKAPALWPAPPEQPRYIYAGVLRNAQSVPDDSEQSRMKRLLTGAEDNLSSFRKPLAVAAAGGRVYVSDTEGRRIFVFDIPRRRTFAFGFRFEGELKKPAGLALDQAGHVYVVDSTARRLIVYDALGLFLRAIDGREWVRPTGVAVDRQGERIYIVDTGGVESLSHRVFVYGRDGKKIQVIGTRGGGPGQFNLPVDAAVGADGTLYVLDAGNFRVQAFDPAGRHLRSFGSIGNGLGQFARPRGIAVDDDGNVYVSDASFGNVQVFNPQGELLIPLGRSGNEDEPGRYLLPAGVAVDEAGLVYIVDQFFHKVEVLRRLSDAEGKRLVLEAQGSAR